MPTKPAGQGFQKVVSSMLYVTSHVAALTTIRFPPAVVAI